MLGRIELKERLRYTANVMQEDPTLESEFGAPELVFEMPQHTRFRRNVHGGRTRFSSTTLIVALLSVSVAPTPTSAAELMKPREPGDLVVVVAAAGSPDYIREWMATKFEDSPRLERLGETAIGEWLYISFLVTGLTPSTEVAYDFTVGYRLLRPDGSILFDEPAQTTNRSKGTARRGWVMSDPALDLLFDETDPPGKYTLEVRVRDNIAGAEATTTHVIHLQDHR